MTGSAVPELAIDGFAIIPSVIGAADVERLRKRLQVLIDEDRSSRSGR